MARARWIVRDPYGGVPGRFVVVEPGVAIPCSLVRRVADGGVPEPFFVEVYDGGETSIGLQLERDPSVGGVLAVVLVFEGPIEDDALRSEWLWGIDPERCEVVS